MSDFTYERGEMKEKFEKYEWDRFWVDTPLDGETKRILSIGDSISAAIKDVSLKDKEKNILYDNLATSKALDNPCFEETIRLYAKQEPSRDVILFNNGLHGWHLEDETEYKEAFDKMIKFLLHEFRGTPIYVVLTTHLADQNREKRVIKRNEAALETAKRYNLPIIDLYKISLENSALLKNDGVHYDEAGCVLFLNEILKTLNI